MLIKFKKGKMSPSPKSFFSYSSLKLLILNNLNNSTIINGDITKPINSKIFSVGNAGMLKIVLNAGTANIIPINTAEPSTAHISLLLLNTFVLKIDFLLFLTLNT